MATFQTTGTKETLKKLASKASIVFNKGLETPTELYLFNSDKTFSFFGKDKIIITDNNLKTEEEIKEKYGII